MLVYEWMSSVASVKLLDMAAFFIGEMVVFRG